MYSCIPIITAFLVISAFSSSASSISNEAEDAFLLNLEQQDNEAALLMYYENSSNAVPNTIGGMVEASLEWPNGEHEQEDRRRRLQHLSDDCVEDGPYFYGIDINISPGGNTYDGQQCRRPNQILLGHDLNLLLLRIGLGERRDDDNILAMGGVCPNPDSSGYTARRMLRRGAGEQHVPTDDTNQHRELVFGFVYRGGYACGWFCRKDDRDARRELMIHNCDDPADWLNCYINQVTRTIEAAIRTDIAPNYPKCLGTEPNIDVTMSRTSFEAVNELACGHDGGEVKEFLESFSLGDFYITTKSRVTCEMCSSLDFAKTGDGDSINEAYINVDTWQASHGVRVSARATYGGGDTPGNKAMAFNANKRTSVHRDMRSPNENCPGGGSGRGSAGSPGEDGENCLAAGNVLVINRSNQNEPEPNPKGGMITFVFDTPVLFSDIGIIDADGTEHRIAFKYSDGTSSTFTYRGFGDNGLQRVLCNQDHVVQVDVIFRETAGITEINFCEHCTTVDSKLGRRSTLVAMEDFEGALPLRNWHFGRVEDGGPLLTTFLGRYANNHDAPHKTYTVPADATSLTISVDLYQIDTWDFVGDTCTIYVGVEPVYLLNLRQRAYDGDRFSGSSPNGITFFATKIKGGELAFNDHGGSERNSDNIWRVEMEVPGGENRLYGSGKLTLKFHADLNAGKSNEALGIDNIKIVANNDCQSTRQLYLEDFEGAESDALTGWTNGRQDTSDQIGFSMYLGRFGRGVLPPFKTWTVPRDVDVIAFSIDFYQFDSWDPNDYISISVGNELINFGHLNLWSEGDQTGGTTSIGLTWQAELTGAGHLGQNPKFKDRIYRIDVQVPHESWQYNTDGRLKLTFAGHTDQDSGDESWGWDNLKISAIEGC